MCGIVGVFDLDGSREIDRYILETMNQTQAHRGPDGCGYHHEPGVGLAHQRLSIIDLSGSQNLTAEAICEAQTKTGDLAARLCQGAPSPVKNLSIGGGCGIPYFPGEEYLDLGPIAESLECLRPRI